MLRSRPRGHPGRAFDPRKVEDTFGERGYPIAQAVAGGPGARLRVPSQAGEAGLRLGELLGLEWPDVDLHRGLLKVQRAVSDDGSFTLPKSGKPRIVPTTSRLRDALAKHRDLRGDRVLTDEGGAGLDKWALKWLADAAERRAGLRQGGRVHILRHTFCTRLAARNVPLVTIKDLAGHRAIETTMRYAHVSAAAPREAIKALEVRGDMLETGTGASEETRKAE